MNLRRRRRRREEAPLTPEQELVRTLARAHSTADPPGVVATKVVGFLLAGVVGVFLAFQEPSPGTWTALAIVVVATIGILFV